MAKHNIDLDWKENMLFETIVNGHKVTLDADASVGGTDTAPRPKALMLVALAGCTAMDVVALFRKMKVDFSGLKINVEAELSEEHPKIYTKVRMIYFVKSNEVHRQSIEKAINLSQEKYCGVGAMFKKFAELTYEIQIIS